MYTRFLQECSERKKARKNKTYEEYERQPESFSERLADAQNAVDTLATERLSAQVKKKKEKKRVVQFHF